MFRYQYRVISWGQEKETQIYILSMKMQNFPLTLFRSSILLCSEFLNWIIGRSG